MHPEAPPSHSPAPGGEVCASSQLSAVVECHVPVRAERPPEIPVRPPPPPSTLERGFQLPLSTTHEFPTASTGATEWGTVVGTSPAEAWGMKGSGPAAVPLAAPARLRQRNKLGAADKYGDTGLPGAAPVVDNGITGMDQAERVPDGFCAALPAGDAFY